MGDLEEPSEESRAAPDLVGLAASTHQAADVAAAFGQHRLEMRPGRFHVAVASGGRVVPRELRQLAQEDQAVDGTHQAQGHGRPFGLALEALEDRPDVSFRAQVVRSSLEERRI